MNIAPQKTTLPQLPLLLYDENRLAYHSLELLLEPDRSCSLVYLSAPSGSGKSLLIRHFCGRYLAAFPAAATLRITANDFASHFAEAADRRDFVNFHSRYRDLDLLVCEDLPSLSGRWQTQLQLLHVIDHILDSSGVVVLSAPSLPGELDRFLHRLIDRFHGGNCSSILLPSTKSRIAFLRHFASINQIPLGNDVVEFFSRQLNGPPSELAAVTARFDATCRLLGRPINLRAAKSFLLNERSPLSLTLSRIATATARHYSVRIRDLRSPSRSLPIVTARRSAVFLCRILLDIPLSSIGVYFNRSHATIHHAHQFIADRIDHDASLRADLCQIAVSLRITDLRFCS